MVSKVFSNSATCSGVSISVAKAAAFVGGLVCGLALGTALMIQPYVKGPADKPIKPLTTSVYSVDR